MLRSYDVYAAFLDSMEYGDVEVDAYFGLRFRAGHDEKGFEMYYDSEENLFLHFQFYTRIMRFIT